MGNKFTLDKIDLSVLINGTDITSNGCLLNGCNVSFSVNSLSQASLDIGYKTLTGLSYLKSLFPKGMTTTASYSEIIVNIKDGGPLGYINSGNVFKGYIVGFKQTKSVGNISYTIQCLGGMFRSDKILIGSPAYNFPGPSISLAFKYDIGTGKAQSIGSYLHKWFNKAESVIEMFKIFVNFYEYSVSKSLKSLTGVIPSINKMALKAYGFVPEKSSVVSQEVNDLVLVPGINSFTDWEKNIKSIGSSIAVQALNNPTKSFFQFFLEVLDTYGLLLVTIWDKTFITVKDLIADPNNFSPNNIFTKEDIIGISIQDAPFYAPTRAVVFSTSSPKESTGAVSFSNFPTVGCYPSETQITPQEKLTGVKVHCVKPYGILEWLDVINDNELKKYNGLKPSGTKDKNGEVENSKYRQAIIDRNIAEYKDRQEELLDNYAKYILMKEQCKQRTGSATLRVRLDVVPGLTASFEDPFRMSNVYGFINSVSHSFTSSSASTNVAFNYVNYPEQFASSDRGNPLYPSFNAGNVISAIGSGGFGTFTGGT